MAGRLTGKVAIVTGAASRAAGIGNGMACALRFAEEGAKVVVVNRQAEHCEALAEQVRARGAEAAAFVGDVTDAQVAASLAAFTVERFGQIDILHNNVGTGTPATVETVTLDAWRATFESNVTSAMLCSKYCVPHMREHGGGAILLVTSVLGSIGLSNNPNGSVAYATAKAALFGLMRSMAADYAPVGIRVNCIIVGSVQTPMVAHLGEEARERRRMAVPLQTEGTAWDVAHGAVYLVSDEARWVTGAALPIDGGLMNIRPRPI